MWVCIKIMVLATNLFCWIPKIWKITMDIKLYHRDSFFVLVFVLILIIGWYIKCYRKRRWPRKGCVGWTGGNKHGGTISAEKWKASSGLAPPQPHPQPVPFMVLFHWGHNRQGISKINILSSHSRHRMLDMTFLFPFSYFLWNDFIKYFHL